MTASHGFDQGYRRWRASAVHAGLIGEGLPASIQPFSFVPLEGLESLASALAITPGQTLIDLGCGRGGPGLWLACRTGARLIGIDSSAVAIADADQRGRLFPGVVESRFSVADVACTGLLSQCASAVVSIDVLQLLDDPAAMIDEAARLARPHGRIVLTTWEGWGEAPSRLPRDVPGLVENAGLVVDAYTEQPAWLERQLRIYQRAAALDTLADPAVHDLAAEGRRWQRWRHQVRRVVVTAHRSRWSPGALLDLASAWNVTSAEQARTRALEHDTPGATGRHAGVGLGDVAFVG